MTVSTEYFEKDGGRLSDENCLELTDFTTGAGVSSKTRQRENAKFLKLVSKAAHNLLLNQRSSSEKVSEQMWKQGKQSQP